MAATKRIDGSVEETTALSVTEDDDDDDDDDRKSSIKWEGDPNVEGDEDMDHNANVEGRRLSGPSSRVSGGGGGGGGGLRRQSLFRRLSGQDGMLSEGRSLVERIRNLIKTDKDDADDGADRDVGLCDHSLFAQLDVLVHFEDGQMGWKEIARWMKYEENVESGDRWSKPHVPTAQMHALTRIRRAFVNGSCVSGLGVGLNAKDEEDDDNEDKQQHRTEPGEVVDVVIETMRSKLQDKISEGTLMKIRRVLQQPHKHKHRKAWSNGGVAGGGTSSRYKPHHAGASANDHRLSPPGYFSSMDEADDDDHEDEERHGVRAWLRRRSGDGKDIAAACHHYPPGATPENLEPYKPNKHLTKKLPKNTESANILAGQVDFLKEALMVFVRLDQAASLRRTDLTEVDIPTRFVVLILGPFGSSNIWELQEIGRAMATLLNDKVFCEVAYRAKTRQHIVDGIDEFLDDLTVLPPSIWDPSIYLDPPTQTRTMDQILGRLDDAKRQPAGPTCPPQEEGASDDRTLMRTGKLFGGLVHDVRSRYKYYWSDFRDAFHIQCLASVVFLFFACITPIVTFGGLLGQKTDGYMGTMETLMSGAVCGVVYAAFAGQPLTIIGATGPLLIFESILYHLCRENGLDFMSFRFWIGAWVTVALLLIVAFDLSALVRYITRFTEESFAILISVIFIYEAFAKILEIYHHSPVHTGVASEDQAVYVCHCQPLTEHTPWQNTMTTTAAEGFSNESNLAVDGNETAFFSWNNSSKDQPNWMDGYREDCVTYQRRLIVRADCISESRCLDNGWNLTGSACFVDNVTHSVADVFFLCLILFFGTFALAIFFRTMRTSRYFPSKVRSMVADFAVLFAVVTFTGVDYGFGLNTPKLNVPSEFVTTRKDRGWLINPGSVTYWWLILLSIIPAVLATILVFLDQQITAVIVNRKEHKLKKGHGYHLDLFVLAFLIFVCSLLGLPWFVAATVRAITHVRSLIRESEVSVPGERPQMLGVRENRLTGICIHLLIGISTLLTGILQLIPMPVLYGVFLYMGITSLTGVQFMQRITILFMPQKYQPDYIFLRHVKAIRIHCFTFIQLFCFALMWIVKTIKTTSIAFPLMLVALMAARKVLDYIFTQSDLYWLDHLLPDEIRREKEDSAKRYGNAIKTVSFGETLTRESETGKDLELSKPLIKDQDQVTDGCLPPEKV